jgi:hypothetical protein
MTARTKWTLAIVGLLLANIVAMIVLIASATTQPARIVPAYETPR